MPSWHSAYCRRYTESFASRYTWLMSIWRQHLIQLTDSLCGRRCKELEQLPISLSTSFNRCVKVPAHVFGMQANFRHYFTQHPESRQGCILAPALFCRAMDIIMGHARDAAGLQLGNGLLRLQTCTTLTTWQCWWRNQNSCIMRYLR